VEYNKILDGKLAEIRRLEGEIQRLIEKNSNNQSIAECEKKLASKRKQIAEKRQELIDVESQYSISAKTKNKIIEDIINQERIKDINCEISHNLLEIIVLLTLKYHAVEIKQRFFDRNIMSCESASP
jgi:hypothetical protein